MNEELKILKEPDNLLHQKCQSVTDFEEAKKISDELLIVIKTATKWWNRFTLPRCSASVNMIP